MAATVGNAGTGTGTRVDAGTGASAGSPEVDKVLRSFVVDGRIRAIPVKHSKKLALLDWLAQDFEPGRRYTEAMVNLIIGQRHADTAALRRYLVDEGFMDRADGIYWRSGGTVSDSGPVGAAGSE